MRAVLQSRDGFLWIGTDFGLFRNDGLRLVSFRADPDLPKSLPDNRVTALCEDQSGAIWVGTARGLGRLDPKSQEFKVFHHNPRDGNSLSNNRVESLYCDRRGRVWVGTFSWTGSGGGLNLLNPSDETFHRFLNDPGDPASLSSNRVRVITEDRSGRIWVGTWSGLNALDAAAAKFTRYGCDPTNSGHKNPCDVRALLEDREGRLWVGTLDGRLGLLDSASGAFTKVDLPDMVRSGGQGDALMALTGDSQGRIWIGMLSGGLFRVDPMKGSVPKAMAVSARADLNMIWNLQTSRDGVLWIGTLEGLHHIDLNAQLFESVELNISAGHRVTDAVDDGGGGWWFATSGSGVIHLDASGAVVKRYKHRHGDPAGLSSDMVSSILRDHRGRVWAATSAGVDVLAPPGGNFRHYENRPAPVMAVQDTAPLILMEDGGGVVWVGTQAGLKQLNPSRAAAASSPDGVSQVGIQEQVVSLYATRDGEIWIGRVDGLAVLRAHGGTRALDRRGDAGIPIVSARSAFSFRETRDGAVWAATPQGLIRFDRQRGTATHYTSRNSALPDTEILNVVEGSAGVLWLTTSENLLRFDPSSGRVKSYENNLPSGSVRFLAGKAWTDARGRISLVTSQGLIRFDPGAERSNGVAPQVAVTGLRKLGQSAAKGGGTGGGMLLSGPSDVELPYRERDFTIEFAALHFAHPKQNAFIYKLDNYDPDWRSAQNGNSVTYTNLPPGRYTFLVRASNSDNVWSDEVARLSIRIIPPWWRTWPAHAAYVLAALGFLYQVRKYELRRFHLENRLREQHQKADHLKELEGVRTRLLANVSHELRTPLTLILGHLGHALERVQDAEERGLLERALRNARHLHSLIDQLLDLSKLEANAMTLMPVYGDANHFTRETVDRFNELAARAKIDLTVHTAHQPVRTLFDPEKLGIIISNLLSNALKYTPSGGKVDVRLRTESAPGMEMLAEGGTAKGTIFIEVEDSGIGIREDDLPRIFDRFYRANHGSQNPASGTGIGLTVSRELARLHGGELSAYSKPGRGSTFVLTLPLIYDESGEWKGQAMETASVARPHVSHGMASLPQTYLPAEDSCGERVLVLIIEDNAELHQYIRSEIEDTYQVVLAVNGEDGINIARNEVPDLIITDLMMPGMDGFEVCRTLRSDVKTSHIPVIMLTAWNTTDNKLQGLETGVDDFISKPFSAVELRARITNLIQIREQLRQSFAGTLIIRPGEVKSTPVDKVFLERVAHIVGDRLADESFGPDELCAAAGLSVSQMHRKLKALIGQTPANLIRSMRLQRAADMIRSDTGTIADACYQTGFSDQAHFTRSFKQFFGCTPTEYRKRPARCP